ncbi:XdhC family protein [Natranaerobius thermophilus]|uniref:Xanthine dehydrogenase n=1 Tax=Natranaerobius thermophilus (strain ATCC BAA-1301 / DSM 18059 / JW/NM-WN-LF) TaxID=457570 RepID=B2A805_NATTJ|nr:XdhC/CoxI family protein [Natranaerobius thermophilus]ACB85777.1 protein of unknown function DUF182 [Natranaerobius thermophilus JW/NM-WN-LF]
MNNREFYQLVIDALKEKTPCAVATVVKSSGSSPAREGAKMLVYEDGSIAGTVGGGALEARTIEEGLNCIQTNQPKFLDYSLSKGEASELGMVCGGNASIFVEPMLTSPELVLVGAGHISQEVAKLAQNLDYQITVMDDRAEFASRENFPGAHDIYSGEIEETLLEFSIGPNTYIVIVTRGHAHDQKALETVLDSQAAYIGMIGSKNKVREVVNSLKDKGYSQEQIDRIYAPIGLDIGGNTPPEIAVSIIAEIQKVRYKGEGRNDK